MVKKVSIVLRSINDAKEFVDLANSIDGEVLLTSGRYRINAKSIMGVFTLNLSVPVNLEIKEWRDEYIGILKPYLI